MSARVKILELCTSMLVQHLINLLKFYELLLLRRNTLLEVLPDGGRGICKPKFKKHSYAVQNVTAVKFSQRVRTNTDIPFEMFAFATFGLLHKMAKFIPLHKQDKSLTGLLLVFLFS